MLLLIPYLLLSTTIAHPVGTYPDLLTSTLGNRNASTLSHQNITQICGTHAPSASLRQAHADFLEKSRQQQQRSSNNKKERRSSSISSSISSSSSRIVVTTYVHFVSTTDQSASYPPSVRNAMISSQMSVLNSLYRPALISFRLAATSWTVNDAWATDANSTQMKLALRRGPYSALNLYFQTNLSSPPYTYTYSGSGSTALLGYCTLPTTITYPVTGSDGAVVAQVEYPTVDYATDGCNVLAGSMPRAPAGLGVRGYELGKTAVHEVGHWFGLLHTFQDNTCATDDPGDYIADTPQQSQSTTGCPVGKDSCPSSPGVDPISNYMDYSTDACYSQFSPDQLARMRQMYGLFRMGY